MDCGQITRDHAAIWAAAIRKQAWELLPKEFPQSFSLKPIPLAWPHNFPRICKINHQKEEIIHKYVHNYRKWSGPMAGLKIIRIMSWVRAPAKPPFLSLAPASAIPFLRRPSTGVTYLGESCLGGWFAALLFFFLFLYHLFVPLFQSQEKFPPLHGSQKRHLLLALGLKSFKECVMV